MPDRLVYSTDAGRVTTCSVCGQPYKQCRCDQPAAPLAQKNDGIVRVMRDRKHRGGKTVTVMQTLPTYQLALPSTPSCSQACLHVV